MASYNLNQVKVGLKILVDGDPCVIVSCDVVKPGTLALFNLETDRLVVSGQVKAVFDGFTM